MYDFKQATIGWGVLFVGFNLLYFPQFIIGFQGMPRRYFDYLPQFHTGQVISSVGGLILAIGLIIMLANLVKGARKGAPAPANPWGGSTLEWQIPSPPSVENFDEEPSIKKNPYDYQ